ncbi:hypothetical protein [uncultured Schumannella sp.]|uniref:hypothetical protein n=1 Tax=uncultured Schumannella sp. TaxID=1195956 RepID=UPI0025CFEDA2|nr:hypothetical protein [uncultured Schumannella sp.]
MNLLRERIPAPSELAPRHERHGIRVVALASGLHRVVLASGEVLGYLEPVERSGAGVRWVSKRLARGASHFTELGDFASADEAIDALRYG